MKKINTFSSIFSFLMIMGLCSLAVSSYCQNKFFKKKDFDEKTWDNAEKKQLNALKGNKHHKSVQIIEFDNLFKQQRNGFVDLTIPDKTQPLEAQTFRMEYKSDTDYDWYATTKDGAGSILISRKKDKYSGYISTSEGEQYQIVAMNGNSKKHVLVEYNLAESTKSCGAAKTDDKPVKQAPAPNRNARVIPCSSPIRVLVLYTPAAANGYNINSLAYDAISQFNSAVYRSNITSNAALTLAGVVEFPFTFSNQNQMSEDVANLSNNSSAQALRNQYLADIVVLITGDHPDPVYTGIVADNSFNANPDKAYAIVENSSAVSNKIFAHEVGHLFGCHHHSQQDNTGLAYSHAHHFRIGFLNLGPLKRTLMSSYVGEHMVENFSNPDVYLYSRATGNASNAHNSRRVTELWPNVKSHRAEPSNVFSSSIEGTAYAYVYQNYTWEAIVYTCNTTGHTYEWRTSPNGFSWSGVVGTGEFFTDYIPWTGGNYYHLWLKVTASNGQVTDAYTTVYIDYSQNGARLAADSPQLLAPISWRPLATTTAENLEIAQLRVYPNPAARETSVEFNLIEDSKVCIDLVDITGKKIQTIVDGQYPKGIHTKTLPLQTIPNGVYILKLNTDRGFISTKLLITDK